MATLAPVLDRADAHRTSADLRAHFEQVRRGSVDLAARLSAEDACVQSMPDASPAKWHLAHVTWFFETFVLEPNEARFKPYHPAFRELFNSYYNGIGKQFSRPDRGMITRPALDEVLNYRDAVDQRVNKLIDESSSELFSLIELGLQHEQQHQELLLMDIKHLLSLNPLNPAYANGSLAAGEPATVAWIDCAGGLVEIGGSSETFHFDNELPRHRVWLEPYRVASRLVTNGEYLEFVRAGAYDDPLLWLADGWSQRCAADWHAPAYWQRHDDAWFEFTLHGLLPLSMSAPVAHVSYYEADAYAQWAGKRLPSEFEWEAGACAPPDFDGVTALHPQPAGRDDGLQQLYRNLWQWTRSAYLPHPGFKPAGGTIGEYNGKFMSNQMTLKGSACITPGGHARATYRNFYYPHQRWAFSGLRLAEDV
jgi:ergothioneine biosynthesis protein EgtB